MDNKKVAPLVFLDTDGVFSVQGATAMSMNEWFCGRAVNSGIESRYPLGASTVFSTQRHRLTSIGVIVQDPHTVAVLGTSGGHLLKVRIYMKLSNSGPSDYRQPRTIDKKSSFC